MVWMDKRAFSSPFLLPAQGIVIPALFAWSWLIF